MARILIVYSTRAGTTAHVANLLSNQFRKLGHDVSVASASAGPGPSGEDLFVVGSGILAGNWNREALEWLAQHRDAMDSRVALFNVCLAAQDPAKRDEALGYNAEAEAIIEPVASQAFSGRYTPEKVPLLQRLLLRVLRKHSQDHLDPTAIAGWARELHDEQLAG